MEASGPIASTTALAATTVSSGQCATGGGGRSATDSISPESTQTRPSLPRPSV